jgi:chitinase
MLAIGGWTWSTYFSLAVRTAASRTSLATSIVTLLQQWPCFKGVTIDWEYLSNNGVNYGSTGSPSSPPNVVDPSDSANFILFLQQLRSMYVQQGWNNYTIAMCCTPAPEKIHFDVKGLIPLLDQWHIMTYEYPLNTSCFLIGSFADGSWQKTAAHQSNLYPSPYGPYSASGAVQAYLSYGVPASKLFIGVPFYSRGFAGTTGLGAAATGPSPDMSEQAGVVDYKALPMPGAVEMWDNVAQAGYSYDPARKVLDTYDVPQAVKAKCEYVIQQGLGGIIIWESMARKVDDW